MSESTLFSSTHKYICNDMENRKVHYEIYAELLKQAPNRGISKVILLKKIPAENWEKCYGH